MVSWKAKSSKNHESLPGIHDSHSGVLEVFYVPCHHREIVDERGGSDQNIRKIPARKLGELRRDVTNFGADRYQTRTELNPD